MNLRKLEGDSLTSNTVRIACYKAILPEVLNTKGLYEFPTEVLKDKARSPRYKVVGHSGTVKYVFEHTNGMKCFIILVNSGRLKGKYIATTRAAFKKTGTLRVSLSNFDTPLNKKLREEHKSVKKTTRRHSTHRPRRKSIIHVSFPTPITPF